MYYKSWGFSWIQVFPQAQVRIIEDLDAFK